MGENSTSTLRTGKNPLEPQLLAKSLTFFSFFPTTLPKTHIWNVPQLPTCSFVCFFVASSDFVSRTIFPQVYSYN